MSSKSKSVLENVFKKGKMSPRKSQKMDMVDKISHLLDSHKKKLRNISDQLSAHVSDIFCALRDLDIRFDFDPFSLEDCRCDFVSSRVINVLCSLKYVPIGSLVIEESEIPGGMKLKLRRNFVDRFDGPTWEQDCTETSSGDRYLDPAKLLDSFAELLVCAVKDVDSDNVDVIVNKNTKSLCVKLQEDVYRINLFPAIRVNDVCENFESLERNIPNLPKSIMEEYRVGNGIHLVANASHSVEDEGDFWSVTYNDKEKRIVSSDMFQCANDCFLLLTMLNDCRLDEDKAIGISWYHLKMIVLFEIYEFPQAKRWSEKVLQKRMTGLLQSLETCLRKARFRHLFTGVNLFANMDRRKLEIISQRVAQLNNECAFQNLLINSAD